MCRATRRMARFEDNRALRPPRKSSPQAGLSRQLEQSLRAMERGPCPQNHGSESAPRNERSSGNAVSRGASPHGAVTEQRDVHMQCGPGWLDLGRIYFVFEKRLPRITRIKND